MYYLLYISEFVNYDKDYRCEDFITRFITKKPYGLISILTLSFTFYDDPGRR